YLSIEKTGLKWYDGLFGSTRVYESELTDLLYGLIGKTIVTPYDYIALRPFDEGSVSMKCSFQYSSWLQINGYLDRDQVKYIRAAAKNKGNGWWRSASLVSISGKINKFTLDRGFGGKRLILSVNSLKFTVFNPEISGNVK
ncbi:MAG: hypothetical protein ACRCUT_14065, partial [Spirochaetota bacterium]